LREGSPITNDTPLLEEDGELIDQWLTNPMSTCAWMYTVWPHLDTCL